MGQTPSGRETDRCDSNAGRLLQCGLFQAGGNAMLKVRLGSSVEFGGVTWLRQGQE